ncbi:YlmG protein 1-2 [Carex littledalei]|uniref:YlmG protein 1-2 n=1 Tax=Carex littledalei TaxID=544730 RepID=A0A833VBX5_9POAL|nr:YlmG protein 1-2 [Carex littledalei]
MATLLSSSSSSHLLLRKNPNPTPRQLHSLSVSFPLKPTATRPSLTISASLLSPPPPFLVTPTRTIASILSLVFSFSRSLATCLRSASSSSSSVPLFASTSSLFFARAGGEVISTPFTVVASTMAKWLEIYSGVLMVRVLLSWFPNIPWDRQPLSAMRDLCDPYMSLFRNIIPPVFGSLDLSPLLAFGVLNVLSSILRSTVI